jgi:hypothetical protein
LRALNKAQLAQFKHKINVNKAGSQAYRQSLFGSENFQKQSPQFIQKDIHVHNSKEFNTGITRQDAEYYNNKLQSKTFHEMTLVSSNDIRANSIKDTNINDIKEIKKELTTQYMGDVFLVEPRLHKT